MSRRRRGPGRVPPHCVVEDEVGIWRCPTHESEQWQVARALQAEAPCDRPRRDHNGELALATGSPRVARNLMALQDPVILQWLGVNPATPVDVLCNLARHSCHLARFGAAGNWRTPRAILEVLAQDRDAEVRFGVADNDRAPVAVLEALARDADGDVAEQAKGTLRRCGGE